MKKSTKKTTLLNKLKSQQLEIIHLISINLINSRRGIGKADKGELNNLQKCLLLNEEITKQIQQWES